MQDAFVFLQASLPQYLVDGMPTGQDADRLYAVEQVLKAHWTVVVHLRGGETEEDNESISVDLK
jgi:hypothetical protein